MTYAPAAKGSPAPQGKGVFLWSLKQAGTPADVAARCQWAGVRWLAPRAIWQFDDTSKPDKIGGENLSAYVKPLADVGVSIWPWGYPQVGPPKAPRKPSRGLAKKAALTSLERFIAELVRQARLARAPGVIVDPEKSWRGASAAQVDALMVGLRARLPGRGLAVTSYGAPWNFDDFPFEAFAEHATCGMPQLYNGHRTYGLDFQAEGVAAWEALGYDRVVPLLGAWDHPYEEMTEVYQATPLPSGAVGWWIWSGMDEAAWAAVRNAGRVPHGQHGTVLAP